MWWVLGLLILAGCKPTEKNYREAYDRAQAARQAERASDAELGIPELIGMDAPKKQKFGQDSAYVKHESLTVFGQFPAAGVQTYNVAVGKYKMTTNAEGNADALRSQGYEAFVLAGPKGEYYTVAGSFATADEAMALLQSFKKKHKGQPYVGLPNEPIIIVPLRR